MKISDNKVSFGTKIKFIDASSFSKKVHRLNPKHHKVDYPWTPDTMKTGKKLYTDRIMDCIKITAIDGKRSKMAHICTWSHGSAKQKKQKGFSLKEFERRFFEKLNPESEDLHVIILGGFLKKEDYKGNEKKLKQILHVFDKRKIPYSIMAGRNDVHYYGKYSTLYENKSNTLYITNDLTNTPRLNTREGLEVEIKDDKIEYNEYIAHKTKIGTQYETVRKSGSLEDYLNNQFKYVKLSKFDEWA